MSGNTKPTRIGYCLGLKVLREVGKNNSLPELVTWNEGQFSKEISSILLKLTKTEN